MNTLSLFLYFADIISRIQGLFIFGAVAVGIFWGARLLITGIYNDSLDYSWNRGKDEKPYPSPVWPAVFVALFAFIACIIPSKETMYLIAGSEIAEVVVKTPEAREIFDETKDAILRVVRNIGEETK